MGKEHHMTVDIADAVDAVYRFAAGQDLGDSELYESAFTADAIIDFSQPSALFGVASEPMEGRETIMANAFVATQHLITTHVVTNPRLTETERGWELYCLVAAQHVDPDAPERRVLLQNHYYDLVVPEEPGARISHMRIVNTWWEGEPAVLFGG
jgi:hypothetical protein